MSIALSLECVGQTASKILLKLVITSHEPHRILIPSPQITGLQFRDAKNVDAEWGTCQMVHASWSGLVLNPEESKTVTFSVRPASTLRSARGDQANLDYRRWAIGITAGRYAVWYSMSVDDNYFDGDSHYRFPDIEKEAREFAASAWAGEAKSNVIAVEHAEPPAPPSAACGDPPPASVT
jgi:hypothetical protein